MKSTKKDNFSIRKLTVGTASVFLGATVTPIIFDLPSTIVNEAKASEVITAPAPTTEQNSDNNEIVLGVSDTITKTEETSSTPSETQVTPTTTTEERNSIIESRSSSENDGNIENDKKEVYKGDLYNIKNKFEQNYYIRIPDHIEKSDKYSDLVKKISNHNYKEFDIRKNAEHILSNDTYTQEEVNNIIKTIEDHLLIVDTLKNELNAAINNSEVTQAQADAKQEIDVATVNLDKKVDELEYIKKSEYYNSERYFNTEGSIPAIQAEKNKLLTEISNTENNIIAINEIYKKYNELASKYKLEPRYYYFNGSYINRYFVNNYDSEYNIGYRNNNIYEVLSIRDINDVYAVLKKDPYSEFNISEDKNLILDKLTSLDSKLAKIKELEVNPEFKEAFINNEFLTRAIFYEKPMTYYGSSVPSELVEILNDKHNNLHLLLKENSIDAILNNQQEVTKLALEGRVLRKLFSLYDSKSYPEPYFNMRKFTEENNVTKKIIDSKDNLYVVVSDIIRQIDEIELNKRKSAALKNLEQIILDTKKYINYNFINIDLIEKQKIKFPIDKLLSKEKELINNSTLENINLNKDLAENRLYKNRLEVIKNYLEDEINKIPNLTNKTSESVEYYNSTLLEANNSLEKLMNEIALTNENEQLIINYYNTQNNNEYDSYRSPLIVRSIGFVIDSALESKIVLETAKLMLEENKNTTNSNTEINNATNGTENNKSESSTPLTNDNQNNSKITSKTEPEKITVPKEEVIEETIPFNTIIKEDSTLPLGTEIVDIEGVPGLVYKVTIGSDTTIIPKIEKVDKVIRKGTKKISTSVENNIINLSSYNTLNEKNNIKETPINNNKITLSTATTNNITKEKNKETSLPNTGITNNNLTLLGVTTLITAGILSRRKIPNKKQTKY